MNRLRHKGWTTHYIELSTTRFVLQWCNMHIICIFMRLARHHFCKIEKIPSAANYSSWVPLQFLLIPRAWLSAVRSNEVSILLTSWRWSWPECCLSRHGLCPGFLPCQVVVIVFCPIANSKEMAIWLKHGSSFSHLARMAQWTYT